MRIGRRRRCLPDRVPLGTCRLSLPPLKPSRRGEQRLDRSRAPRAGPRRGAGYAGAGVMRAITSCHSGRVARPVKLPASAMIPILALRTGSRARAAGPAVRPRVAKSVQRPRNSDLRRQRRTSTAMVAAVQTAAALIRHERREQCRSPSRRGRSSRAGPRRCGRHPVGRSRSDETRAAEVNAAPAPERFPGDVGRSCPRWRGPPDSPPTRVRDDQRSSEAASSAFRNVMGCGRATLVS